MLKNRETFITVFFLFCINYNLYFLNEELLIYSVALLFLNVIYYTIKRHVTRYQFKNSYMIFCENMYVFLAMEQLHLQKKLLLLQAKYNNMVENDMFRLSTIIVKNQILFFKKLIALVQLLNHQFFIRSAIAKNNLKFCVAKNVKAYDKNFKSGFKPRPGKPW